MTKKTTRKSNKMPTTPSTSGSAKATAPVPVAPLKTPMYAAIHAPRYQRQSQIKALQSETKVNLLCYVSGTNTQISRDDIAPFVDMLHNVPADEPVDLLLHTPGGDIDAAEKLVMLLRAKVGEEGSLRIIVPDYAKSAGTLMALGANKIVMGDTSELGTIDPQIWLKDGRGNEICHSVLNYLDAFKEWSEELRKMPTDPVALVMIEKFDPTTLRKFNAVKDRARTFAENQLKRRGCNWSKITSELMNTKKYPSHGQTIARDEAESIGLDIEYLEPTNVVWCRYWELYCQLRLAVQDHQKIFESSYVSLMFDN